MSKDLSLPDVAIALVKRWRAIVSVPLLAALITVASSYLIPPTYTAVTSFVPESSSLPGAVASLAGQLGISLGGEAARSPHFYADLLRSRELMERVVTTRFRRPGGAGGDSATLVALLGRGGSSARDSIERAVRRLSRLMEVNVNVRTNVVRLSVDARDPHLAADIANRFIELLNEFNTTTRQSQARARRNFLESRIREAAKELKGAEDALQTWLQRNRSYQSDPELVFQYQRLQRRLDLLQQTYLALSREYETARIEEVNDTPVVTLIDTAVAPSRKSKPSRSALGMLALLAGGIASVFGAIALYYLEGMARDAETDTRLAEKLQTLRAALSWSARGQNRKA